MAGIPPRLLRRLPAGPGRQQRRGRLSPSRRMNGGATAAVAKTGAASVRRRRRPSRARKATPQPVSAGADERVWLLDPPFRTSLPGARFDRARKAWVYVGVDLPEELAAFRYTPYSRRRWLEDEASGVAGPGAVGGASKSPLPIQTSGAEMIKAAAAGGWR